MDYYQTLGVSKNASDLEIKSAYRKQALQWHPDRNKSPEATEKFKAVNEAYEVLGNPDKKASYDQFGHDAFKQGASAGSYGDPRQGPFSYTYKSYGNGGQNPFEGMDFGGSTDPFEIFEQFFGGGFSSGPSVRGGRGRRQVFSLKISFMEAVKGTQKQVDIGGKPMTIKIPAGVDDGSRVRFGDFDIVLSVETDRTFKREGFNIYIDKDVDFADVALGTTIEVPTTDGMITLKVPSGTQPDTVIRLRGRGVNDPRGGHVGDQYVRIKVKVPAKLSGKQKELMEELQQLSHGKKRDGWF